MIKNYKESIDELSKNTGISPEEIIDGEYIQEIYIGDDYLEDRKFLSSGEIPYEGTAIGYIISDNSTENFSIYDNFVEITNSPKIKSWKDAYEEVSLKCSIHKDYIEANKMVKEIHDGDFLIGYTLDLNSGTEVRLLEEKLRVLNNEDVIEEEFSKLNESLNKCGLTFETIKALTVETLTEYQEQYNRLEEKKIKRDKMMGKESS